MEWKPVALLAENHKNRGREVEVDRERQRGGDVMETDEERKVFIIKERREMIGWEHKTDGDGKEVWEDD